MHIDSGNMILFKAAQELQVVKTPDKLTDRELTRAIRDAIIAEEGAVKQYETIVDATDNIKTKEVLQDIANEEKVHVGELQKLLSDLLKDEQGFLDDGAKEVKDK
jgi:rubrerythrin